jgi:ArsR family transcriptional regulator, arsenate/arsenite/antimonite-responsive transcriptional repressor
MTNEDALGAFAALSNASRLAVLRMLVRSAPEGRTAGDIARHLGASPSQTSFHLTSLSENGLVVSQRRSREIMYRIDFGRISDLATFLLEDCCGGRMSDPSCCG